MRLSGVAEPARHLDSRAIEVYLLHARFDERERQSRVELEHVVGDAVSDLGDAAERAPSLFLYREADEVDDVERVWIGRRQLGARDLDLGAAGRRAVEPDHGSAAGTLRGENPRGLAF